MGRMREVVEVRSLMAQAIRRAGRAPGKGPGTVKRLAYAWGVSRQYANRVIEGEGCLQQARSYLNRLVGTENTPFAVVDAVACELVAALAMKLTDRELADRLHAARAEALASDGPARLALWLYESAPSQETLNEAISAVSLHMWDLGELVATMQAMQWRGP